VDPQLVVDDALAAGTEGLTLLGGEPFDQPEELAELTEIAQRAGLGVICFTGYSREDLVGRDSATDRLMHAIDLLVDGPYVSDLPEQKRSLVGSTNQRFIHLTDRYSTFDPTVHRNRVDVRIGVDGSIDVAGFLGMDQLDAFTSIAVAKRRRRPRPAAADRPQPNDSLKGDLRN